MMNTAIAPDLGPKSEIDRRVSYLMQATIDFIPNADFQAHVELEDELDDEIVRAAGSSEPPAGLPSHLQRMCESKLLTFEQEQALFKAMNYRKFRAHELRSRLDPESADPEIITGIESLLAEAQAIRDHIVKANVRLVISIVKKFVSSQHSFDEMLSDGLVALMNCVDKFDYDRGFRFSTYAYRSISRDAYRTLKTSKLRSKQFAGEDQWVFDQQEDKRKSSSIRDGFWNDIRNLTGAMMEQLDRRERFIIRCRYALGSHRKVKSLQFLANKLGISKERTRQLEIRAVEKLRNMAANIELDDVFGSAVL